jgi:hypothetical protein
MTKKYSAARMILRHTRGYEPDDEQVELLEACSSLFTECWRQLKRSDDKDADVDPSPFVIIFSEQPLEEL